MDQVPHSKPKGQPNGWRLVLGVVGSDPHSVGNRILARSLSDAGYTVFNLGAMVPIDEFVAAARESACHAVLVSSLSGFGEVYAREFRSRLREAGVGDVLLYMGGNVVNGTMPWPEVEAMFREFGFDRVYPPQTRPSEFLPDLEADLRERFGEPDREGSP